MNELVLGRKADIPESPDKAILDTIENRYQKFPYVSRFTAPEFTSLCPVTGQPDFATLIIDYVPHHLLIESKSLKLFLTSFRNHGAFHEDCTLMIGKRVWDRAEPHFLRIAGFWYPRGGIPIDVYAQFGSLPLGVTLPDFNVAAYRGR